MITPCFGESIDPNVAGDGLEGDAMVTETTLTGVNLESGEGMRSSADESEHHEGRLGTLRTNSEMSR